MFQTINNIIENIHKYFWTCMTKPKPSIYPGQYWHLDGVGTVKILRVRPEWKSIEYNYEHFNIIWVHHDSRDNFQDWHNGATLITELITKTNDK